MKVLHVAPSFYPATYWGGPIFSTLALCQGLAQHDDLTLRVLTTDAAGPHPSQRLPASGTTCTLEPGFDVTYTRRLLGRDIAPGLLIRAWEMIQGADIVHLTGTYSFPTLPVLLMCKLLGKPVVWSPRGALQASSEWHESRSPALKRIFERMCSLFRPRHIALHCTAEIERDLSLTRVDIKTAFILPNGIALPPKHEARQFRPEGRTRLMALGRLDPKKGLEIMLDALTRLPPHITLDIYGTGEDAYRHTLLEMVRMLGLDARVHFHGEVLGPAKDAAFSQADLFVLPSFSENFGIVIAESLAHGVPVIASRATPWAGLETHRCGRWIENNPAEFITAIQALEHENLAQLGENGRAWMQESFAWPGITQAMAEQYARLIALASTKAEQ